MVSWWFLIWFIPFKQYLRKYLGSWGGFEKLFRRIQNYNYCNEASNIFIPKEAKL